LLVWLNPRAAHSEFQPLAGPMAAALDYCDLFLPAHSLAGLYDLFLALASDHSGAGSLLFGKRGRSRRHLVQGGVV